MREFSVPEVIPDPGPRATMADAVFANAEQHPASVVFSRRSGSGWSPVTAAEFAGSVTEIAAGLIGSGVHPGDRVGLMCRTRYEWTLVDYAIWSAGAVTVPIYETSSAEQVEWICSDAGVVALVLETPTHEAVLDEVADRLPALTRVWQIDAGGLDTLIAGGRGVDASAVEQARHSAGRDDLATIIYTSGTTGRPKGCELTHLNLMGTALTASTILPQLFDPEGSTLLFLPLAHVFGRLIQGACVQNRVRMGHTADIKNLVADFGTFAPTFILAVPRVFEKIYNSARQQADATGKGKIFDRGAATAIAWSESLDKGGPGLLLKLEHALFERILYAPRLRAPMGGRIAYAVSGGGPLGTRLGHFFRGMGITILEGYGLTESTASGTVNTVDHTRIGSVGQPSPGCGVRIADDGEILLSGRNILRGYWQNETATKETLEDGWLRTGDIGELDAEGYLSITGRKKELIVTAGGKNVAPAVLEDRLRAHPLVSQCIVVGDNKPFIGCLVTIDPDAFGPWKQAAGKAADATVADLVDDSDLRTAVQSAVDDANKAVSHAEAIKVFVILPDDFSEADGTLTPSIKVKRNVVMQRYAAEVTAIYASRRPGSD